MEKYYPLIIIFAITINSQSLSSQEDKNEKSASKNEIVASKFLTYIDLNPKQNKKNKSIGNYSGIKDSFDTIYVENVLYYIVEGDLLFDEEEIDIYIKNLTKSTESEKIVGIKLNGMIVKIPNPKNIRYSIIRNTFRDENEYNIMVKYMHEATSDWSNVCNVNFIHEQKKDSLLNANDNPVDLAFVVKKFNANAKFIAKAFFPYYPKHKRKVLIDDSFFTSSYSQSGILRHELGHVLGFRHEHIRSGAPARCPNENTQGIIELTQYDPKSVMHYFCGGIGTKDMKITENDGFGASIHYPYNN